jgi:hypothetical protein
MWPVKKFIPAIDPPPTICVNQIVSSFMAEVIAVTIKSRHRKMYAAALNPNIVKTDLGI